MALLSHLHRVCKHPAYLPPRNGGAFYPLLLVGLFIYISQYVSDTLITPADKLLLSVLKKLGGHSAISERYQQ